MNFEIDGKKIDKIVGTICGWTVGIFAADITKQVGRTIHSKSVVGAVSRVGVVLICSGMALKSMKYFEGVCQEIRESAFARKVCPNMENLF